MAGELRDTFDAVATQYDAARPQYPDQLYDDLTADTGIHPPADLLEVGCGPGTATGALARRGFAITAVELGPRLAAEARRTLAGFPAVDVVTAPFETWQPDPPRRFDLVYAATAWHWVDPRIRYERAADLLRPGGHLAVWAADHGFPVGFDPFFAEIQQVYDEIGESHDQAWTPTPPEDLPDGTAELQASGRFTAVAARRYVWARRYTADGYLGLLDTFSGHICMAPDKRAHLYAEIRRRLAARPDGELTRHWAVVLTIGQRR